MIGCLIAVLLIFFSFVWLAALGVAGVWWFITTPAAIITGLIVFGLIAAASEAKQNVEDKEGDEQ